MSLQTIAGEFCSKNQLQTPSFAPRPEYRDTRVQCGTRFFHARDQEPGESDETYAVYLGPHLGQFARS